jgi:anti-sigma-K factor RskA
MCEKCERARERETWTEMDDHTSIWRTNVVLVKGFATVFVNLIFSFKHKYGFMLCSNTY